jgi:hypothetical protein
MISITVTAPLRWDAGLPLQWHGPCGMKPR